MMKSFKPKSALVHLTMEQHSLANPPQMCKEHLLRKAYLLPFGKPSNRNGWSQESATYLRKHVMLKLKARMAEDGVWCNVTGGCLVMGLASLLIIPASC